MRRRRSRARERPKEKAPPGNLGNIIIVPSQFACRAGPVSLCLPPRIPGSLGSISEVILGLGTMVCLTFSHKNRARDIAQTALFCPVS